ncbi:bifunctional tetrahydrofolate synthase/dihydrofolate synthase [Motilimonas pumila]|uniref:Dihydrofolate synthase/folylpolyglutamate synthase n=1 Tax=Motilimonas pumila TaxID=2303987 RepID=A0A418YER7_9GAMM|nr:bifunctional tetrahydrofolate synthase/dihydrofolate synthase [Motilimonas pumila]RJG47697.1 bifunctional tetrahydrofolate synthase/dihydrofolate synthase [Motilimonas pumila]
MNNLPQTLAQWLTHLERLHPSEIELGLDRVRQVAQRLNLIHFDAKLVLVGGTNGKGTTCAMLESILLQAGYKVGVYCSPHLIRYTERVRINRQELTEQAHCQSFLDIEKGRGDIALTYFEFGTLSALNLLKQANLDVVLLEVGLGGRLDATNIVEPDVSVVTTVDIDHVDWLGDNREDVGFEKAGIYRKGKPAICGDLTPPQSLIKHVSDIGANLVLAKQDYTFELASDSWQWQNSEQKFAALPLINMPIQNAATALACLHALQLNAPEDAIVKGLADAQLAGRMQVWQTSPKVILDVAHNPQSAQYLAQQLVQYRAQGIKCLAVVGMLKDKDIAATMAHFCDTFSHWYLADLQGPRGAKAEELKQHLPAQANVNEYGSVVEAYQQALTDSESKSVVIVFGSFYTVADIIALDNKG